MSIFDQLLVQHTIGPAVRTDGTHNGAAVDRSVNGGMQDAVVVLATGVITDGSHALTVEDSADGSTGWTALTADQLQGDLPTATAADDDTVFEVGVHSTRQFLRAVVETTGATTGGLLGVTIALNAPRYSPVSRA